MNNFTLPDDISKQWEILLLLITSEEKKIDRTNDTEIDTMNYFLNNDGIRLILLQWLRQMHATYAKKTCDSDTALKCDEVSLHWRQQGNDKFRANIVEESYRCYSNSVMYAHQKGPMYPLALANRSAALLKMKRFQECLDDLTLAIEHGYPSEQRHKLFLRRADCHIELRNADKARDALTEATQQAQLLKLTNANLSEFERHVKLLERKMSLLGGVQPEVQDVVLPSLLQGENDHFIAASSAIELRRSESAGRYVSTSKPTKRGDVLFSEEPYAWVTLPNDTPVCEACCQSDINPVPCARCSRSVYCSVSCRSRAAGVHRWECVAAQARLLPTIGIAHLALRVLVVTAEQGFPKVPEGHASPASAAELFQAYASVDNVHVYEHEAPPFYRMFNLVTNFDKMNNTDYIQYVLTAVMLTLYLDKFTSFLEQLPAKVPYTLSARELRLFCAAVLLRSLGQLVCNGHAALTLSTVDLDDGNGRTVSEREVRRATAIYPSAAMMNHSCDPNIINTFYKSRLIVRCSRELSAGGAVLNCYGPHRAREPTRARRAALRAQYMFTCECTACSDTDRKDAVLVFSAFACQSCKGPVLRESRRPQCQQCRSDLPLERTLALLDRADELIAQADQARSLEERCERIQAALRVKQQALHRHHSGLRATADRLARLYADKGEFSKSVELIKQNIQSLEYQFGSFSVEVAHELRKLSDVMLERIVHTPQHQDYRDWCLEAHKVIKKTVQLMELNYGSWEPLVKRLVEQETIVGSLLQANVAPNSADIHHNLHYNLKI